MENLHEMVREFIPADIHVERIVFANDDFRNGKSVVICLLGADDEDGMHGVALACLAPFELERDEEGLRDLLRSRVINAARALAHGDAAHKKAH